MAKKKKPGYYCAPRGVIGPEDGLKWLAVDLDGTLAEFVWPDPGVGAPIPSAVRKVKEAVAAGWKVVIHTSRPWDNYEMIEMWLNQNEIPFHSILCAKLLAAAYIDDRNINPRAKSWIPKVKGKK